MPYTTTYCEKCGQIGFSLLDNINEEFCITCCTRGLCKSVPDKYLDKIGHFNDSLKDEFINEVIKKSPNFNQETFDKVPGILAQRRQMDEIIKQSMSENSTRGKGVSCSYCGSNNVKKIGLVSRYISTGLFGFASSKAGKQWHCNKCGSDF